MSDLGGPSGSGVARAKALAFYLPQYHPIPENDEWWGKGFTEWVNVTRARPLFPGHHQPHVPGELGYYDLRVPEVREAQAELARDHGLSGFIYYHYWFEGRRLLERPFDEVLASGSPDFPFALCWANEEWTRNWDGESGTVLVPQRYSDEDDRAHIRWLLDAFADDRYIKVDGRPLMLVYHPSELPDPRRTTDLWRAEAQAHGFPDLFLVWSEGWGPPPGGPGAFGFDATMGFMPPDPEPVPAPLASMRGHRLFDYVATYENVLRTPPPPWTRFPSVMAGWDNTARRPGAATMYTGATPEAYGDWLERTVTSLATVPDEERLIALLAWNEWAEGNHLEPDRQFGRAFLEATRHALTGAPPAGGAVPAVGRRSPEPAVPAGDAVGGAGGPAVGTGAAGAAGGGGSATATDGRTGTASDPDAEGAGMPGGPWALVLGMHRSATSAVTGALGALGFQMPSVDDRLHWPESNLEHWESRALTVFDDDLLDLLGGSWDAPPDLAAGWEQDLDASLLPDPASVAHLAFPAPGPLVWKDPRLCLLYPFWRPRIPDPVAAVLLWRSPMAVATSLAKRDDMEVPMGIALWERYNRSALCHLDGVDTYIADYQSLLDDPRRFVESLADWLGSLPQFAGRRAGWDLGGAVSSLARDPGPRPPGDTGMLLTEQRQLVDLLTGSAGGHRPFRLPDAGPDSPWTTAMIASRRNYRSRELTVARETLAEEVERNRRDVESWQRIVDAMVGSTSWRVTRPLREVVARLQRSGRRPGPT